MKLQTGKHDVNCGYDLTPARKSDYLRTFAIMGADHQICQYCGLVIYDATKTEKEKSGENVLTKNGNMVK